VALSFLSKRPGNDDLPDSSSWSSPPLVLLREIPARNVDENLLVLVSKMRTRTGSFLQAHARDAQALEAVSGPPADGGRASLKPFSIVLEDDADSICDLSCLLTYLDNFVSNRHKSDATRFTATGGSSRMASDRAGHLAGLGESTKPSNKT